MRRVSTAATCRRGTSHHLWIQLDVLRRSLDQPPVHSRTDQSQGVDAAPTRQPQAGSGWPRLGCVAAAGEWSRWDEMHAAAETDEDGADSSGKAGSTGCGSSRVDLGSRSLMTASWNLLYMHSVNHHYCHFY